MSYDRRSPTMENEHKIASLLIRWGHARVSERRHRLCLSRHCDRVAWSECFSRRDNLKAL